MASAQAKGRFRMEMVGMGPKSTDSMMPQRGDSRLQKDEQQSDGLIYAAAEGRCLRWLTKPQRDGNLG
jgi:hypothetical protein